VFVGGPGEGGFVPGAVGENPWEKVLGAGAPAAVVLVSLTVLALSGLYPHVWASTDPVARWTALSAVGIGALVAIPPLYDLAALVMGTDAIAWRLTWIVPVPALVALLAGMPRRWPAAAMTLAAAAALLWGGLPLWHPANGAWVASPGAWKMAPSALSAAAWVVDQRPDGRVLAPVETIAAIGAMTADVLPVSSRDAYLEAYAERPDALIDERRLLQRLAEGGSDPADLARAPEALAALKVDVVCSRPQDAALRDLAITAGYRPGFDDGTVACLAALGT
jgi:hypothetical protein